MKYLSRWLCALVALVALCCASCSSDVSNGKVEYIPFQESKDGLWGMISLDGKVLFSEEFKNEPTIVRDGRFFVKNNEGMWEMYTADAKPKKVGGEYVSATAFSHGRALVTMPNKPVCIINTDGEVVKELDRIAGKKVARVGIFNDGIAVFESSEGLAGAIDEDGNCIIEPKLYTNVFYSEGNFFLFDNKDGVENQKVVVCNKKGAETYHFNTEKYEIGGLGNGYITVAIKKNGENHWQILNEKGETLYKASDKVKKILQVKDKKFIYYNGDGYGVMDFKREVLVRAKYDELYFDGDRLIASKKVDGRIEYKLIDLEDKEIGKESYLKIFRSSWFDGKHSPVQIDDNSYGIVDEKGELLEKLPDMVNVSFSTGNEAIASDYVDMDNLIKEMGMKASGVDGFSFQSSAQSIVQRLAAGGYLTGSSEYAASDAYWYDVRDELSYSKGLENVSVDFAIHFPDKLSRATYSTETEYDEYWDYSYEREVQTGYAWNNVKPNYFVVSISNNNKMRGKLRILFDKLAERLSTMGTLAKGNSGAKVYKLTNGMRAFLAIEAKRVFVFWGDIAEVSELDIEPYKDAQEDKDVSAAYSNDESEVYDTTAVDSAAY